MNIFDDLVHHHSHQEQPMQPRMIDSLHAITGELASNPLIARLAERRLGAMLTQAEADSIVTLIAGIEQVRAQHAQMPDPASQPQPAFTAAQQQPPQ